ncbi:MAG: sarcosine oxidase subunit delta [Pseudomonadota bacterium]
MLKITCPFCGPRNESEFIHGGPARPRRPEDAHALTDEDWVAHLTVPDNPIGPAEEKWWHVRGCGQWVTISRHTVTHEISDNGGGDG